LELSLSEIIALLALTTALLALGLVTIIAVRQRHLINRYRVLFAGDRPTNLDDLLVAHSDQLGVLDRRITGLETHQATMEINGRKNIQTPGIVRFQAFTDTGSDLSFAIALLDKNHDGIVISSLYGRSESRVYAKPIRAGQSTYTLSDEEKEALEKVK